MKVAVEHVWKFLEHMTDELGYQLNRSGLIEMEEDVNQRFAHRNQSFRVRGEYLYKNLFCELEKARRANESHIGLNQYYLNMLASAFDFRSFKKFEEKLEATYDKVLLELQGWWTCFVRRRTASGAVLGSPVEIRREGDRFYMTLFGPRTCYKGELINNFGCLNVLLKGYTGKFFHHNYKLAGMGEASLFQGVYSGCSSDFQPIAGRVLLVREDERKIYPVMSTEELKLQLDKRKRALGAYFDDYSSNLLQISQTVTFDIEDLL